MSRSVQRRFAVSLSIALGMFGQVKIELGEKGQPPGGRGDAKEEK